ncbi:hypothetical protein TNCV_3585791 [Trichonephila clavipes]|nr:hypothetical protein TNCV_3585791 [Trichonephila clavipes]
MKEGRFVPGTFRSERMRVLYRSRQDDRLRVMLTESVPEADEIGNVIEEVVDLARSKTLKNLSFNPVQSEDRMTIGILSEDLSLIEKGLQILENIDFNEDCIFSTKQGIKELLACCEKILREKKKESLSRQAQLR